MRESLQTLQQNASAAFTPTFEVVVDEEEIERLALEEVVDVDVAQLSKEAQESINNAQPDVNNSGKNNAQQNDSNET